MDADVLSDLMAPVEDGKEEEALIEIQDEEAEQDAEPPPSSCPRPETSLSTGRRVPSLLAYPIP